MDFYILDKNEICIGTLTTEGYAPQVYSAKYTEKINDMKVLELELANISTIPYDSLKEENYIVFQQEQIEWDMFIIKRIEENHGVDHTISVYAEHCSQELLDDFCRYEIKDKNYSPSYLLNAVLDGTRWEVWEVENPSETHACTNSTLNQSVLQAVQSIRAEYNLNLDFKIDFVGNQVARRKVFLKNIIGTDNNKTFEYSKDVDNITREVDTADLKTAIIPIGGVPDKAPENTPPVDIKGITWTTPTNPLNKPIGEDFLEDRAATDLWGYGVSGSRKRPRYVYWENTEIKDSTTLINEAYKLLLTLSVPKVNYKMSVIDLLAISGYDYNGYGHEKVNFGDTVNVIDREFNPPLIIKTQVISREIDLLHPENPTIELGTLIKTVADGTMSNSIGSTNSMSNQIQIVQNTVGTLQSTKVDVESFTAETARIDNLESSKASITDLQATNLEVSGKASITSLNTEKARIDTLNTNLTTTNNLVATKADITALTTQTARIDTLNTNVTTTNNLVATKADITSLTTQTARIDTLNTNLTSTNNLVATKADITALNTEKARIDTLNTNLTTTNNLVATKAAINDLTASNGRITSLESTTASINTLVNGNITSDNMAAGAIQAGDATIAVGAIGNAHISSLQADKLTSGTVDTSKVVVQGSNGRLKIQNNKLQVTALNGATEYERVALGDVNGNGTVYGLRVRGADGTTVLIDENGVKSEGITNGAISNNHINSGANIDGSKLNVASVVTSINNGTTNIQGNKIAVNNSTLDVQFSNIQTTENSLQTQITSQGSQVTQLNNQITLKVDQTTYDQTKVYTTQPSSPVTNQLWLDCTATPYVLKRWTGSVWVASTSKSDIDTAINNLKIGGRNLLPNSSGVLSTQGWTSPVTTETVDNKKALRVDNSTTSEKTISSTPRFQVKPSTKYIVSYLVKGDSNASTADVYFLSRNTGSANTYDYTRWSGASITTTTTFTKYSFSFTTAATETEGYIRLDNNYTKVNGTNCSVWFSEIKFEEGDKATDWTPCPDDIQGQMDSTLTRVGTAETNITQLQNSITLKANQTDVTTLQTDVNTAKGNITDLQTRMSGAELKITPEAIVSTVRGSSSYVSDLGAKANSSDLSALTTRVSTSESSISVLQGQITSKVTQTDINTSLNNMQLGGRNYFLNTEFLQPLTTIIKPLTVAPWNGRGSYTGSIDTSTKYKDKNTFKVNAAVVGVSGTHDCLIWTALRNIAISTNIKTTMYLKSTNGSLVTYRLGGGTGNVANKTVQLAANTWTKVDIDLVTNGAQTSDIACIFWLDKIDTLWVALPMLEVSTKASEWTPAPEDMQGQMDSTTTRMTSAESSITQHSNSISLKVDTSTYNTYTTANDSNIATLDSRMDSAELKITDTAIVSTVRSSSGYTGDMSAKTDKSAIISTINQTAEAIKISANKIDITGAVTFSSLDSSTQTKVTNGDTANTTVNANKSTWDTASTNATTALNGTSQYRNTGVPTNNPVPSSITTTTNTNGTVNYKLGWNQYTQGANKADFIMLFWRKDSTTPTVNDSSVSFNVNTTGASYYMFEGVNPADTFSFGIAAARKTENGLEIGAIQCPTTTPDWLGVTTGTPNFTGNVNGTSASTVVTNASNGNTANATITTYKANWDDAKAKVDLWKHASDVTKIDGGDIYTGTITANSISAGTITSNLIATTGIVADKIVGGTLTLGGASNTNGVFQLKNSSNVVTTTIDRNGIVTTGGASGSSAVKLYDGYMYLQDVYGGSAVGQYISATDHYMLGYCANAILSSGSTNSIDTSNTKAQAGVATRVKLVTQWFSLSVPSVVANSFASFDNLVLSGENYADVSWVVYASASSLAHEFVPSVVNWANGTSGYLGKVSLRLRNVSGATTSATTVKVGVMLATY